MFSKSRLLQRRQKASLFGKGWTSFPTYNKSAADNFEIIWRKIWKINDSLNFSHIHQICRRRLWKCLPNKRAKMALDRSPEFDQECKWTCKEWTLLKNVSLYDSETFPNIQQICSRLLKKYLNLIRSANKPARSGQYGLNSFCRGSLKEQADYGGKGLKSLGIFLRLWCRSNQSST